MTTVQQREQRLARVRQVGSEAADPERTALRAGPVSLFYEAGDLRYLCLEGREVVRRIYVAVRDRNWDTVPTRLSQVRIAADPDAFTVSFRALHESGDLRFAWTGCIQGHSDGSLRFEMDGRALSTFLRNRIGFCILHPLRECVGQPCRFTTADGQRHTGSFPAFVSPHQPFLDLTAFAHPVRDGLWAELEFQGDLFEMEDHRNWTDGSFKTYCTPLRLPFPVAVPAGEPIRQAVTLTLHHEPTPSVIFPTPRPAGAGVQIAVGDPLGPLPHLGLEIAADAGSWSPVEAERFRALRLEHLRVSLDLRDLPAATRVLALAGEQADAAEAGLLVELRFPAAEEPDLAGILETARRLPAPILAWLVFREGEKATSAATVALARRALAPFGRPVPLGGGTRAHFAELNRNRPPEEGLNLATYSLTPQVHAFDTASLVENLEAQADTIASARRFLGNLPVAVGPVTLRPRFNPNATGPAPEPPTGELPAEVDERQMSLFAAGWTLGSLAVLAQAGAARITYYETTGPRGVMETEQGSPFPARFLSQPGEVFPLYCVLAETGQWRGAEVQETRVSHPLRAAALSVRRGNHTLLSLANLTEEPLSVTLVGAAVWTAMRELNADGGETALQDPLPYLAARSPAPGRLRNGKDLLLPPYGLAWLWSDPPS